MKVIDIVCIGVAEFLGTGILVFVGCMGCVTSIAGGSISSEQISFTFGLTVMFVIQIFGHISGSHINPAVTLAAVILGYVPYILAPLYFIAQFVGAVLGFLLLKAVTPKKFTENQLIFNEALNKTVEANGVCSTIPNPEISIWQALIVEFVISFVLVLLCAAIWDHRNKYKYDSIPIRFGLTIAGLAMAAAPYTGASMNPARSFGPALINNDWDGHWIYWVGPLLAAVIGAGGYRALFSRPEPKPASNEHVDIPLNITNHENAHP